MSVSKHSIPPGGGFASAVHPQLRDALFRLLNLFYYIRDEEPCNQVGAHVYGVLGTVYSIRQHVCAWPVCCPTSVGVHYC